MKGVAIIKRVAVLSAILLLVLLSPTSMVSHCNTMNGLVVKAAKKALKTGSVNLVWIWIQPNDEAAIKESFDKTVKIRSVSPEVKELADMYFFETLVRIDRAGEGELYTGLKTADTQIDPCIEAADEPIDKGTTDDLLKHLHKTIDDGISKHFKEVLETTGYDRNDTSAGRSHVKNYVTFIHYIEQVYDAATKTVGEH